MTAVETPAQYERDATYFWDTVFFLVEGCIFRLPRYHFTVCSEDFAAKFGLPDQDSVQGPAQGTLGYDESNPIRLNDVSAADFRVFLRLLFPLHTTTRTIQFSQEEWLIILRLSTIWSFWDFRKMALKQLEITDPIERIEVARRFHVSEWLISSFTEIISRPQGITEDEGHQIGLISALRLYIIRDRFPKSNSARTSSSTVSQANPPPTIASEIESIFSAELSDIRSMERNFLCKEEREIEEAKEQELIRKRAEAEEEEREKALQEQSKMKIEEKREKLAREKRELVERQRQIQDEEDQLAFVPSTAVGGKKKKSVR